MDTTKGAPVYIPTPGLEAVLIQICAEPGMRPTEHDIWIGYRPVIAWKISGKHDAAELVLQFDETGASVLIPIGSQGRFYCAINGGEDSNRDGPVLTAGDHYDSLDAAKQRALRRAQTMFDTAAKNAIAA